jgi:hypothetical protein
VLAALGVEQWVGSRDECDLDRIYLERLLEDLDQDRTIVERGSAATNVTRCGREIYPLVARGAAVDLDVVSTFVAAYQVTP